MKVNNESRQVLDKLWELTEQNHNYYKLNNDPTFMSLIIEKLDDNTISLCHYGEQNGDLMRDPEMIFWKDENGEYSPFYFRNDYLGIEEFSGELINNKLVIHNKKQQNDQTDFSNTWLTNIKFQQEL